MASLAVLSAVPKVSGGLCVREQYEQTQSVKENRTANIALRLASSASAV